MKKIKNVVEFVVLLLLIVFTVVFIFDFVVSDKLTTIDIVKNYLIIFGLIGLCFLFVDIVANRIKEDKKETEKKIEKEYKEIEKKMEDVYNKIRLPGTKEIAIEFFKWYFNCEWYLTDDKKWIYTNSKNTKETKNISELFDIFLTEYKKENEK